MKSSASLLKLRRVQIFGQGIRHRYGWPCYKQIMKFFIIPYLDIIFC